MEENLTEYYRKQTIDLLKKMKLDKSDLKFIANIWQIIKAHGEKRKD